MLSRFVRQKRVAHVHPQTGMMNFGLRDMHVPERSSGDATWQDIINEGNANGNGMTGSLELVPLITCLPRNALKCNRPRQIAYVNAAAAWQRANLDHLGATATTKRTSRAVEGPGTLVSALRLKIR